MLRCGVGFGVAVPLQRRYSVFVLRGANGVSSVGSEAGSTLPEAGVLARVGSHNSEWDGTW